MVVTKSSVRSSLMPSGTDELKRMASFSRRPTKPRPSRKFVGHSGARMELEKESMLKERNIISGLTGSLVVGRPKVWKLVFQRVPMSS